MSGVDQIVKSITDQIRGTKKYTENFQKHNPDEEVLISDAAKGIKTTGGKAIKIGTSWAFAPKDIILLTDRRIVYQNWSIPLEEIKSAELCKFSGFVSNGLVLKIATVDHRNFQFGIPYNSEWIVQKVFDFKKEDCLRGFSNYAMAWRAFMLVGLIYFLMRDVF